MSTGARALAQAGGSALGEDAVADAGQSLTLGGIVICLRATPTARLNVGNCSRSHSMGATPPVAPRSSVRRLACGTVCTVVEYGSVEEIELYHFQPFVRRGRTRPREYFKCFSVPVGVA